MAAVELICVGNELLIGKTLNTNAHWLTKRITSLGLKVRRITTVADELEEISSAIKEALARKPRFIITTGGLGPTFDDKTLEGIAKALNLELKVNDEALKMIEEKYEQYVKEGKMEKAELTPHRVKMATLPEGAKPLPNPVGTAPGVLLKVNDTVIIALPGVPSEMKAIFEESVLPILRREAGSMVFYEASIEVLGIVESEIAPIIDQVMHDNPYVYIKSHPKGEEKISRIELHFSTTSADAETAKNRVGRAIIQISEMIKKKGGKIRPMKMAE